MHRAQLTETQAVPVCCQVAELCRLRVRLRVAFINSVSIGFALILSFISVSLAHAQDAEIASDVRCVVVGLEMSRLPEATQQTSGTMLVMYYLGRLDRVVAGPNLEGLIANAASQMSTAELQSEAVRCGKALIQKGQLLQRIGSTLRSRKLEDKKPGPSQ